MAAFCDLVFSRWAEVGLKLCRHVPKGLCAGAEMGRPRALGRASRKTTCEVSRVMNQWLYNWSISTKLRIMVLLGVLALLSLAAWQIKASHERGWQAHQHATRSAVESALGVLQWAHGQETAGKLSRQAAQQLAMSAIAQMRYGGQEYFWINDMAMRMVMHPIKPELNGQDVSGMKDPNGKALFKAFVQTVQQGKQGFVDYQWPRPGTDKPVDKLSYVHGFEPWGWVIGSGIYVDDLKQALWSQVLQMAAAVLVLGALMLLFSRVIATSIVRGINKAKRVAQGLARGDLTQRIETKGRDDVGQLISAMSDMLLHLRNTVGTVQGGARSVEVAAGEIASGNNDLSARTEQQASALEETAASMEQLSATVRQNADNASEANRLAQGAADVAVKGGDVVGRVVDTMKGINDSSRRIADIIGVIDGIAFQTNILALNAAVEAARAGEQGRGFAVVANEVRSLAQRSADAAKEIKQLITASVERVDLGTTLVDEAGTTMADVVSAIKRVTDIVGEISTASAEQSAGVAQVGQAVTQMDQATQQNAALVEQSAAAAESLKVQAQQLAQAVSAFRV
jgi:methyl-accepting chemotaxis protein